MKALVLLLALSTASCGDGGAASSEPIQSDLGHVSIGDAPKNLSVFTRSDCDAKERLSDCTANDAQGRRYVLFGGALSRVSLKNDEAAKNLILPAGMTFGESIEVSKEKAAAHYHVGFDRGIIESRIIYSSGFDIQSPSGVHYSLELMSDEHGRLEEIVQRTDF